jgi:hypothetical protein
MMQNPPSSYTPSVLAIPASRRQDWRKWEKEIDRLWEKCQKLKAAIERIHRR